MCRGRRLNVTADPTLQAVVVIVVVLIIEGDVLENTDEERIERELPCMRNREWSMFGALVMRGPIGEAPMEARPCPSLSCA